MLSVELKSSVIRICIWFTCHTPTIALAIRMRRMTKGSTKAVIVPSPSSNQASVYKKEMQMITFPHQNLTCMVIEMGYIDVLTNNMNTLTVEMNTCVHQQATALKPLTSEIVCPLHHKYHSGITKGTREWFDLSPLTPQPIWTFTGCNGNRWLNGGLNQRTKRIHCQCQGPLRWWHLGEQYIYLSCFNVVDDCYICFPCGCASLQRRYTQPAARFEPTGLQTAPRPAPTVTSLHTDR